MKPPPLIQTADDWAIMLALGWELGERVMVCMMREWLAAL